MKEKSIYFAVEKIYCILGAIYIIFMLEFSGFKSLESLVSLVRLHRKVSKSRETFKVRDFVNTNYYMKIGLLAQIKKGFCM